MTDIASVNSIESPQRSDAEVEGAMVLLGSGLSSVKVSELTGIPASTLRDWQRSSTLVTKYSEAIKESRVRITMRLTQFVEQLLDDMEDGTTTVTPLQLLTMFGIATDKVQKDEPRHAASGTTISVFVGVKLPDSPNVAVVTDEETIEGTAREVGE